MVSGAKISQYLQGLEFPVRKQDAIEHARSHNAPQDVLDTLTKLPDRQYFSLTGIVDAIGEVE